MTRQTAGKLAGFAAAVVFVVGTIGPPLFGRGVFLASDLLYFAYPWRATADEVKPLDYNLSGPVSDTIDAAYPAKATFGEAVRGGDFRTWVVEPAGGEPLGPTLSGVTNPSALSFVIFPAWFAPAMEKLFQLAAALGFTYLFCRRIGADRGPALFGAIAFAGSGFMVMWTNWEQTDVAAWIPALFWASERFLQKRTVLALLPLAASLAAMLVGFFPAIVFYALYVLLPYVGVRLLADSSQRWRDRLGSAVGIGSGLLLGAGLAAYALVPFAVRLMDRDLGDRAQSSKSFLGMASLVTTVAPTALGLSTEGAGHDYYERTNQVEAISFLGATTVLLALLAVALPATRLLPRGARAVLGVATVVLGIATYHGGIVLELLQNLPAFDNSFIGRTRSVLGFTVAALAALGAQALTERRLPDSWRRWLWAGGVSAVTGGVALVVMRSVRNSTPPPPQVSDVRSALVLPALVALGTAVAAVVMVRGRRNLVPFGMGAIVALLLVESLSFAAPLLPNEDRSTLYPETPGIDFLQSELGEDRFATEGRSFFGNTTMLFGLRQLGGHVFFQPTWKELILKADPGAFQLSETYSSLQATPEVVESPLLDRLAVKYWASTPDHPPLGERSELDLADGSCATPTELEAGSSQEIDVPPGAPLRAVVVEVCLGTPLPDAATVVADQPGSSAPGILQLPTAVGPGELAIPLPEADGSDDASASTVSLRVEDGDGASLSLAATPAGTVAADAIRASDDGLRLVYADDLYIYERAEALPRIRWAGRSKVIGDKAERIEALADDAVGPEVVVLDEPVPDPGDGASADVEVVDDGHERIDLRVRAQGAGFVVIADALQSDWVATVDGESVPLVHADHAGVAVAVPEGSHRVVLHHEADGQRIGLALTGAALVVVAALVLWDRRGRRQLSVAAPEGNTGDDVTPSDPPPAAEPGKGAG